MPIASWSKPRYRAEFDDLWRLGESNSWDVFKVDAEPEVVHPALLIKDLLCDGQHLYCQGSNWDVRPWLSSVQANGAPEPQLHCINLDTRLAVWHGVNLDSGPEDPLEVQSKVWLPVSGYETTQRSRAHMSVSHINKWFLA